MVEARHIILRWYCKDGDGKNAIYTEFSEVYKFVCTDCTVAENKLLNTPELQSVQAGRAMVEAGMFDEHRWRRREGVDEPAGGGCAYGDCKVCGAQRE